MNFEDRYLYNILNDYLRIKLEYGHSNDLIDKQIYAIYKRNLRKALSMVTGRELDLNIFFS